MEGEFDRSLLPDQDRLKGWEALKGLHSHSRRSRKSLHASRNWIVHLFSGDKNAKRIEAPKDKGYQVLTLDLQKCRSEDLRSDALWNALIWGARQGRIAHVIGAPPRSAVLQNIASDHKRNEPRYEAERSLVTRMLLLHCVATAGRLAYPDSRHVAKEVGLLVEYPDFAQPPESLRGKVGNGFWDSDQWKEG